MNRKIVSKETVFPDRHSHQDDWKPWESFTKKLKGHGYEHKWR